MHHKSVFYLKEKLPVADSLEGLKIKKDLRSEAEVSYFNPAKIRTPVDRAEGT